MTENEESVAVHYGKLIHCLSLAPDGDKLVNVPRESLTTILDALIRAEVDAGRARICSDRATK